MCREFVPQVGSIETKCFTLLGSDPGNTCNICKPVNPDDLRGLGGGVPTTLRHIYFLDGEEGGSTGSLIKKERFTRYREVSEGSEKRAKGGCVKTQKERKKPSKENRYYYTQTKTLTAKSKFEAEE